MLSIFFVPFVALWFVSPAGKEGQNFQPPRHEEHKEGRAAPMLSIFFVPFVALWFVLSGGKGGPEFSTTKTLVG